MRKIASRSAAISAAVAGASALFAGSASAAGIATAGALLVNLRADNPTAGTPAWLNTGSLGGAFVEAGDATVTNSGGVNYVQFDANEGYRGPAAPADVTLNSDRSIEVWVRNPVLSGEDTMVALGHRGGPDNTNLAFNYGSNEAFNAVGHWASGDMGWNGAPSPNTLHHLVYTYDGTTASVYADGVLKNSKVVALSTYANITDTINLIAQNDGAGNLAFIDSNGMDISVVRIHGGALTAAQVLANFNAGVTADVPEPASVGILCLTAGAMALARRRRRATDV
jgi:hypothetical protein